MHSCLVIPTSISCDQGMQNNFKSYSSYFKGIYTETFETDYLTTNENSQGLNDSGV